MKQQLSREDQQLKDYLDWMYQERKNLGRAQTKLEQSDSLAKLNIFKSAIKQLCVMK